VIQEEVESGRYNTNEKELEDQRSKLQEECEGLELELGISEGRQQRRDKDSAWDTYEDMRCESAEKYFGARRKGSEKEPGFYTKQFPILIKGTQGHYTPWATQDLERLVALLLDLHEGAGKWIRNFEDHTVGKLLAVGDIRALTGQGDELVYYG
jgi:hypothetical protein